MNVAQDFTDSPRIWAFLISLYSMKMMVYEPCFLLDFAVITGGFNTQFSKTIVSALLGPRNKRNIMLVT